eukprot:8583759-Pyramimonas_sp.AAC.1
MARHAEAAVAVEGYAEYLHDGIEEVHDAPRENWAGILRRRYVRGEPGDDPMSEAETTPVTGEDLGIPTPTQAGRPRPSAPPI